MLNYSRSLAGFAARARSCSTWSFAEDLIMASFMLDSLLEARTAIDAMLVGAVPCSPC